MNKDLNDIFKEIQKNHKYIQSIEDYLEKEINLLKNLSKNIDKKISRILEKIEELEVVMEVTEIIEDDEEDDYNSEWNPYNETDDSFDYNGYEDDETTDSDRGE